MIDLRSDTFTQPTPALRERMATAPVGDDYHGEDPSVNRLERYCAELFNKEAALFVTTGMLANAVAVAAQVSRGNEVIAAYRSHIHLFESAQHAALNQVVLHGWSTPDGILRAADVSLAIRSKPRHAIYSQVELVAIENTLGGHQGSVYPLTEIAALRAFTAERNIALHLDGARLFNAHVATGIALSEYARHVDTLSVCFSKALCAPVGSILLGPAAVISRARRLRMWFGSGFHKAGMLAEGAFYALTNHLPRLREDHRLARLLAERIHSSGYYDIDLDGVQTNMVSLNTTALGCSSELVAARCREHGLLVNTFPPDSVRLVVCRLVAPSDIEPAADILIRVAQELARGARHESNREPVAREGAAVFSFLPTQPSPAAGV